MKNKVFKILMSILFLFGYVCLILPTALDTYSRIGQTTTISGYESIVEEMSNEKIEEAWVKSAEYNKKIAEEQTEKPYVYTESAEISDEYLSLPLENSDQLCSIVISKINVNVPVGHGTSDELLQKEAGHLYGTSLPIGGASTHSVIAAHSALQSSELFTRLDELEKGDYIDVKVLNETHRYVVDKITICLPEDCNKYLQIEEGKDLITLYTCTPYGINTHRLLIRASRIDDPIEEKETGLLPNVMNALSDNTVEVLKLGGIILFPIVFIIIVNVVYGKRKKTKKE